MAGWALFAREPSFGLSGGLPIISASLVAKHLAVSTAVVSTPFTPEAWAALGPSCGLVLRRRGRQEFGGLVQQRQLSWDEGSGQAVIKLACLGDEQLLADRLAFPDPLRADDDQTVNDYWEFTGKASTAMLRLISDQAGPTCRASRQVPGLRIDGDPGVGVSRNWQAPLFTDVLGTLGQWSVASGANLGVRLIPGRDGLVAALYLPRQVSGLVRFSVGLSNLVGLDYTETAPKATDAVAAGQGDLHARMRRAVTTTSPLALSWGRRIWSYIDRRDTADPADLLQAATDAVTEGDATVSASFSLTDSEAVTYGIDWGLGDLVTVHVGVPGHGTVATVEDVVREVQFTVDSNGAEKLRAAVGTPDATTVVPTLSQQRLADLGRRLAGLEARS